MSEYQFAPHSLMNAATCGHRSERLLADVSRFCSPDPTEAAGSGSAARMPISPQEDSLSVRGQAPVDQTSAPSLHILIVHIVPFT